MGSVSTGGVIADAYASLVLGTLREGEMIMPTSPKQKTDGRDEQAITETRGTSHSVKARVDGEQIDAAAGATNAPDVVPALPPVDGSKSGRAQLAEQREQLQAARAAQREFRHTYTITLDRDLEWGKFDYDHGPNLHNMLQTALQSGYRPKGEARLLSAEPREHNARVVDLTYTVQAVHATVDKDPTGTITPSVAARGKQRESTKGDDEKN